jgi:hypothetical protein
MPSVSSTPLQTDEIFDRSGVVVSLIREDAVAARQRQTNMRFLARVDPRYWPDAQDVLILALRRDPSESVRIEAAAALGRGYYCTKASLRALTISLNASEEDGYPAEASARVRETARKSLRQYVDHFSQYLAPNVPLHDLPEHTKQPQFMRTNYRSQRPNESFSVPYDYLASVYYEHIQTLTWDTVLSDANKVLTARAVESSAASKKWTWPQVHLRLSPSIRPFVSLRGTKATAKQTEPPVVATQIQPSAATTPTGNVPSFHTWWKTAKPVHPPEQTTEEPPLADAFPAPTQPVSATAEPTKQASVPTASTYSPLRVAKHTAPAVAPADHGQTRTIEVQPKERMLNFFYNSTEPGYREWAAYQLADIVNAHLDEQLMRTLRHAAENDPDALVRLACSRSLEKLQLRAKATTGNPQ